MIDKSFDAITETDINRLVQEHQQEGRTLEFKRELPGGKDSDRKEFLSDISSFANAMGGDVLYGIDEQAGRAQCALGVNTSNAEADVLRLDSMIRDGIRPRLIGYRVKAIPGFASGPVFLVRVPRSFYGPHIVSYQHDFRFYSRSPMGKFRMDVSDIRDAMLNATSVAERARAFRAERLGRIMAGETATQIRGASLVIVHILPHGSLVSGEHIDLNGLAKGTVSLLPFYTTGHSGPRFNLDGIYAEASRNEERGIVSYVQLFRTGIVESSNSSLISDKPEGYLAGLPSGAFADALFRFVGHSLKVYAALGVGFPLTLMVTLTGVKALPLYVSSRLRGYTSQLIFDRDIVPLPELILEDPPDDVRMAMRPLLDMVWQAAGADRCLDYDDSGNWNPH